MATSYIIPPQQALTFDTAPTSGSNNPVKSGGVYTEAGNLAAGMAILANNNTHAAIASGQYVYVRGHGSLSDGLYMATAAIAANGTLSTSNLTAASGGGLNALKSSLNSNFTLTDIKSTLSSSVATIDAAYSQRIGTVVVVQIRFTLTSAVTPSTDIISGFDRSISNYGGVNAFRLYDIATNGFVDAQVTHPDATDSIESLRFLDNVASGHSIRGTFMYIAR